LAQINESITIIQLGNPLTQTTINVRVAIDPYARVEDLIPAEQQMVEVGRALHLSADLVIMDEPTASLS
jgi:ABC-type sugar transport system ATPase subunit